MNDIPVKENRIVKAMRELGIIEQGSVHCRDGEIVAVAPPLGQVDRGALTLELSVVAVELVAGDGPDHAARSRTCSR